MDLEAQRREYNRWVETRCEPHQRYECRECAEAEIVAATPVGREAARTEIELTGFNFGWFSWGTIRVMRYE